MTYLDRVLWQTVTVACYFDLSTGLRREMQPTWHMQTPPPTPGLRDGNLDLTASPVDMLVVFVAYITCHASPKVKHQRHDNHVTIRRVHASRSTDFHAKFGTCFSRSIGVSDMFWQAARDSLLERKAWMFHFVLFVQSNLETFIHLLQIFLVLQTWSLLSKTYLETWSQKHFGHQAADLLRKWKPCDQVRKEVSLVAKES